MIDKNLKSRLRSGVTTRAKAGALLSSALLLMLVGCSATPAEEAQGQANLDDWATNMQSCLAKSGWDVEIRPDGGISMNFPDGQRDAYERDSKECESLLGYDVPPKYSDEQLRDIYGEVIKTADCIRGEGLEPGTPPSEQTFVEQVRTGQGGWDPYSEIYGPGGLTEDEYFALLEKCPRTWH